MRSLRLPSSSSVELQTQPTENVIQAIRGCNGDESNSYDESGTEPSPPISPKVLKRERARIMANWDPCFPDERISWYEEYIQRQGPMAVNWLALPRHHRDHDPDQTLVVEDHVEARGVALYRPDNHREGDNETIGGLETLFAVSPLDNGSVCLWDMNGTREEGGKRRGAIVAKSRPGILFLDGPGADNNRRSKRVDSGVTECVSVDSWHNRAFFAVQSRKF